MIGDNRYEPAPPPVDMARLRQIAQQGQFLREHADLISPWAFHPNERLKRHHARGLRNWGEAAMKKG